ncbi:hypothetical protein Lser_V15G33253 [Lactuca serriola]
MKLEEERAYAIEKHSTQISFNVVNTCFFFFSITIVTRNIFPKLLINLTFTKV